MTDTKPVKTTNQPKSLPSGTQIWEGSSSFVEQGRHWSSSLIWLTSGLFATALVWAFTARIDQTITVRGQLEPAASVKDIDSPSAGVVNKVFVKDGDTVKTGQPLLNVEAKGLLSKRDAIERSLKLLDLQASSLQEIIQGKSSLSRTSALTPITPEEDAVLAAQMYTARSQTQQLLSRLEQINAQLQSRQKSLQLKQELAKDLKTLYDAAAISRHSYLIQMDEVQSMRAQVASLQGERTRVLGEASAQLNQINRQTINLRAELVGLKEALGYHTIKAPISGTVFDVKVGPSSVVSTSKVLLKIVPADRLQARVKIPNSDVGFVRPGLPVSVGVDSFSAGEFGYIQGKLLSVGSDALEPDRPGGPSSFPAVISLMQQEVLAGGQKLNLQSGMAVNANIKLRSRPAISLLTDMFTRQFEGIKRFR